MTSMICRVAILSLLSPAMALAQTFEGFFATLEAGVIQSQTKISHDHHLTIPTGGPNLLRIDMISGKPAKNSDMTVIGGLGLGYSLLLNPCLLVGVEAHATFQNVKMDHNQHLAAPAIGVTSDFNTLVELDNEVALLAKVGWLMGPQTQLYALLGPQRAHFSYNANGFVDVRPLPGVALDSLLNSHKSIHKCGYVLGLGMEHGISCNSSVGLEYQYARYGSLGVPHEITGPLMNGPPPSGSGFHNTIHVNTNTTLLKYNYYFCS